MTEMETGGPRRTYSLTVVLGLRFVVDCLTNLPVMALRPRVPPLLLLLALLPLPAIFLLLSVGPSCEGDTPTVTRGTDCFQ